MPGFQRNAFQSPGFQVGLAQYRLLRPHYINNTWYDTGSVVLEGRELPFDWPPTLAVDPLNSDGAAAFWDAGPRGLSFEDLNYYNLGMTTPTKPVTYWVQQSRGVWVLTGLGATFPPVRV